MKKIKIIKNSIAFVIAIIITITAIIMPEVFNKVNSSEITKMLSSKDYYEQNDVIVVVYEFSGNEGIGSLSFSVDYNGDNLEVCGLKSGGNFITVSNDNLTGNIAVSMINTDTANSASLQKNVKIAVAFRSCYYLLANYIDFFVNIKEFFNYEAILNTNYFVTSDIYVYKNGCKSVTLDEYLTALTQNESLLCGDIDFDGDINSFDAYEVLRYSVGLEAFSDLQVDFSDVDGDGAVTSADSLEILRSSVGLQ